MIQLTKEIAQQLVEFVSAETGFNMIICNPAGVIIGDNAKQRLGVRHDGAARIMAGECESFTVTSEDAQRSSGRMREGYNNVLKMDGRPFGTFGIGGPAETVKPIAKIAAAVIVARLKETKHLELIGQVATEISRSIEQITAAIQKIYSGSEELNAANLAVSEAVSATRDKVQKTNKLIDFILDVADQTGLLGLNAAILSAQAGIHGRGFGVVAEEIRKLAKNSTKSADEITEILEQIQSGVAEVSVISEKTSGISEQQYHATQQIARDMATIKKSVDTLASMAQVTPEAPSSQPAAGIVPSRSFESLAPRETLDNQD